MPTSFDLYTEKMLTYWEKAQHPKHPSTITYKAEITSELCGDNILMEANIIDGILVEIGMFSRGCCVCVACAEIVREFFVGNLLTDVMDFTTEDLKKLIEVEIPKNRESCMSVGLQALKTLKKGA